MNFASITSKAGELVRSALGPNYNKLVAASPKIALGVGIAGVIGGCVAACVATTKLGDILDEHDDKLAVLEADRYEDDRSQNKEKVGVYLSTCGNLVKNYAPAFGMIGGGVALILVSHNIMDNRLTVCTSAYEVVSNGFKEYREAVVKELGEEADAKFRFGIEEEKVEETTTDKNGKEKKVEFVRPTAQNVTEFARVFDEGSENWSENPEYNLMNLRNWQNTANDMLWARGSLLLNEVYDMLGLRRTEIGKDFGWTVEPGDTPDTKYVDFGIYDWSHYPARKDFINGYNPDILLDFNVDGPVKY